MLVMLRLLSFYWLVTLGDVGVVGLGVVFTGVVVDIRFVVFGLLLMLLLLILAWE